MPSSGPRSWIAGRRGVGPSGSPGASESFSSGGPPARDGAGASGAAVGGSASSSVAPMPQVVAAPPVTAAGAPGLPMPDSPTQGSPAVSAASSGSDPGRVKLDVVALQRECDLARGRFSAASVEIEHLRDSLLLMVLKSEIRLSSPASFHNIQPPNVVVGLNSNQFHKFW